MWSFFKQRKLLAVTFIYWLVLLYAVAALLWWFVALTSQNSIMTSLKISDLKKDDYQYEQKRDLILALKDRKNTQYIGEGLTFLAVIMIGAVFVYRYTRKQFLLTQQQNNFMMAVTHELKTPIAVAKLNLQTIQQRQLQAQVQQTLISDTLDEVDRLQNLAGNILLAAQFESNNYRCNTTSIDVNELVTHQIAHYKKRYPSFTLNSSVPQHTVAIKGELLLIQMLVSNLIENAIKYSQQIKQVDIELHTQNQNIILCVKDYGAGILPLEKKKIFTKFYRSGNESIRNTKGTGLGLYLCKKIAEYHQATIEVSDNHPQGAIFTITFTETC